MSDHLAEARGLAAYAAETHAGPEVALMFAAQAQVHATLYLAEQQRLANTFAAIREYGRDQMNWPVFIREALGVGVDDSE